MDLISALLQQAFTGEEGRWEAPDAGKGGKQPSALPTSATTTTVSRAASAASVATPTPAIASAPKATLNEVPRVPVRRIEKPSIQPRIAPIETADEDAALPEIAPAKEVAPAARPVTPTTRKTSVSVEAASPKVTRVAPASTPSPSKAERAAPRSFASPARPVPERPARDFSSRGNFDQPEPRAPYRGAEGPSDRRRPAYTDRPPGPRRDDRPPVSAPAGQRPYRETPAPVTRPVRPPQPEAEQPASDGPIKSRPAVRPDDDKRRPWQKFQRLQGESRFQAPIATVQLKLNVGSKVGIEPSDIVDSILGETGLEAINVGQIEVGERTSTVEVASQHSRAIVAKLNRAKIKGQSVKARIE